MSDVGLLTMKSGISQQTVLAGEGNTFMGAVTENYVAQQLTARGMTSLRLGEQPHGGAGLCAAESVFIKNFGKGNALKAIPLYAAFCI